MTHRSTMTRAFTLVEILIVVVILGILAAIVIPQFTNASEEASVSALKSQLQTARSQIELYRVKNLGASPFADPPTWDNLLDPPGGERQYLQAAPVNPFTGQSAMEAGTGWDSGSAASGWVWDSAEEQIFATGFDEATNTFTAPGS